MEVEPLPVLLLNLFGNKLRADANSKTPGDVPDLQFKNDMPLGMDPLWPPL